MSRGQALVADIEHFRMRVLMEALDNASRAFWLRRAAEFDAVGTASARETAQACRNRATLAPLDDWPEVRELLAVEVRDGVA